ncbi:hypothetical protein LTS12_029062, partial [Elasticomyces elasticus]
QSRTRRRARWQRRQRRRWRYWHKADRTSDGRSFTTEQRHERDGCDAVIGQFGLGRESPAQFYTATIGGSSSTVKGV